MLMLKDDLFIKEKFGLNFELTIENAKDAYICTFCNSSEHIDLHEFLLNHFSLEEIIRWNAEYVNLCIDEIEKVIGTIDYKTVYHVLVYREHVLRTYVNDYDTLKRIVGVVKLIGNTYGYFYEYYWKIKDDSYDDPYFADEYIWFYHNWKISTREYSFFQKTKNMSVFYQH